LRSAALSEITDARSVFKISSASLALVTSKSKLLFKLEISTPIVVSTVLMVLFISEKVA